MRNHPLTINQEGFWNLKKLEVETDPGMGEELLRLKEQLAALQADMRVKDAALAAEVQAKEAALQAKEAESAFILQSKEAAQQAGDAAVQSKGAVTEAKDALIRRL